MIASASVIGNRSEMSLYFLVAVVWDGWEVPVLLVIVSADVVLVHLHIPMSWFDDCDGDPDRVLVSWVWVAWTPVEGRGPVDDSPFHDRYDVGRVDSIAVHGCCLTRSVFGIGQIGGGGDLDPTIARCLGHPSQLLHVNLFSTCSPSWSGWVVLMINHVSSEFGHAMVFITAGSVIAF